MSYPRKATISNRDGFPCWCSRLFQRSALQQNAARRNALNHASIRRGNPMLVLRWSKRVLGVTPGRFGAHQPHDIHPSEATGLISAAHGLYAP